MSFDRKYLVWALGYAVAGMCVGLYMGASGNHGEMVAHAHILLIGFAVSLFYGLIHKLWLARPQNDRARTVHPPPGLNARRVARPLAALRGRTAGRHGWPGAWNCVRRSTGRRTADAVHGGQGGRRASVTIAEAGPADLAGTQSGNLSSRSIARKRGSERRGSNSGSVFR